MSGMLTMSNFSGVILQGGPELFAMSDHEETPQDAGFVGDTGSSTSIVEGCGWQTVGVGPTVVQKHATICARRTFPG